MFVHRESYLKTGLGKTQGETTTATEEINNREGKRHLPFNSLSAWGAWYPTALAAAHDDGARTWGGGTLAVGGVAGGGGYGSALLRRRPRKTTLAA